MRASTVFILALCLLIALAAAAGAKYAGLFEKKAPPPPAAAAAPPKVLVAKINLFKDVTVTADQVYVRELRPEEQSELEGRFGKSWAEKLMRPLATAAHLRVPRQNILADTLLFASQFADQALPDSLSETLEPNTRAVNVAVMKDKAGGGALRIGEYVDVFLTTRVAYDNKESLRTACIARSCKVVMKRNNPWTMMAADPDDKPVHFTLQANVYRAALIDYAQVHGQVSLLPVPIPPKGNGSYSDPTSKEYATEDRRIEEMNRGERLIGDEDLVRIFQIPPTTPPSPPRPLIPPIKIQHFNGVNEVGITTIVQPTPEPVDSKGSAGTPSSGSPSPSSGGNSGGSSGSSGSPSSQSTGASFGLPSATGESGCKSCEERKRKAAEDAKYKTIRSGN